MVNRSARFLPIVLLLLSLIIPATAFAAEAPTADSLASADAATTWVRTQIRDDGGIAGFGDASDPSATADAIVALAAAGIHPASVTSSPGADPVSFLADAQADITDPGVLGKVAMAFAATGHPLPTDLVTRITDSADATTAIYGQSFYGHLTAVLGLSAAGQEVPATAIDAITAAQAEDGSWGFTGDPAAPGDSNTTALAIQALAAVGAGDDAIAAGLAYLATVRDANGAVGYDAASVESGGDANSTALAIQAVTAAGEDPASWEGGDLITALAAFQNDSGAFQFQPAMPDDSMLATVQAIPALLGEPLPIRPIAAPYAAAAAEATETLPTCDFVAETQHNICEPFRAYWNAHGGPDAFGQPLTEMHYEGDLLVQYFERARFEWHSELAGTEWQILLGLLGAETIQAEAIAAGPIEASGATDCNFITETQHNVCGEMLAFWQSHGGVPILGFPLTEANEVCNDDGCGTVQVFERARITQSDDGFVLDDLGIQAVERALAR